jgi:stearoyl-CoA desaturase (delta-9 desaturase)
MNRHQPHTTSTAQNPARLAGVTPPTPRHLPNWVKTVPFVALHLALVAVFFVDVSWQVVLLCFAAYFWRMFGITAGYHRYFAHRAYKTSRVFQFALAWLGCSSLQKGPLWWAAHHREHHRHSDTPQDPHSPHETTFWWSHVGWILSTEHVETPWASIPDWAKYPELRWLDRYHWLPGLCWAVACWLMAGWSGLVWGFVVSTILLYHGTFTINSLSHLFGNRRYHTSDDSRNNWVLALITLGEGWHNNHHHYQSSVNQGFFWWEIDISYSIVWLLSKVGLTWDLRKPGEKALTNRLIKPVVGSSLEEVEARARA